MGEIHGVFDCHWQMNVIHFELKGSFNFEGVVAAHNKVKAMVAERNLKTWKLLILLEEDTFLVWEGVPEIKSFFNWCSNNNCQVIVYVVANSVQIDVTKKVLKEVCIECKFFYDKDEATTWLGGI